MSRITIAIAEDITKSLMLEKRKVLEIMKKELSDTISKYMMSILPKEIKILWKDEDLKKYLKTIGNSYFIGQGLNNDNFYYNETPNQNNSYSKITLPKEVSLKVSDLNEKIKTFSKELKQLEIEIFETLKSLGTFKKIEESFPEAAMFLPKTKVNTSLMINIKTLRDKLK